MDLCGADGERLKLDMCKLMCVFCSEKDESMLCWY